MAKLKNEMAKLKNEMAKLKNEMAKREKVVTAEGATQEEVEIVQPPKQNPTRKRSREALSDRELKNDDTPAMASGIIPKKRTTSTRAKRIGTREVPWTVQLQRAGLLGIRDGHPLLFTRNGSYSNLLCKIADGRPMCRRHLVDLTFTRPQSRDVLQPEEVARWHQEYVAYCAERNLNQSLLSVESYEVQCLLKHLRKAAQHDSTTTATARTTAGTTGTTAAAPPAGRTGDRLEDFQLQRTVELSRMCGQKKQKKQKKHA